MHQCRLSTTASGAMARCTLTSPKLPLPCTNNQKPSPPQQDQDNKTTKWEGMKGCGRPVMSLPCWPSPPFFCGGREIQGQCEQSITTLMNIQSRSFSGRHVSTGFLDPVLGAMMKQVCWHSRHSKAYRSLPEARMAGATVEETAFEDVNMWQAPVSQKPPLMGT